MSLSVLRELAALGTTEGRADSGNLDVDLEELVEDIATAMGKSRRRGAGRSGAVPVLRGRWCLRGGGLPPAASRLCATGIAADMRGPARGGRNLPAPTGSSSTPCAWRRCGSASKNCSPYNRGNPRGMVEARAVRAALGFCAGQGLLWGRPSTDSDNGPVGRPMTAIKVATGAE